MKQYLRRLLKKIYRFLFKPFFKNGININIGGSGNFRFDYIFLFSRFNTFGTKHNSGFKKWLDLCRAKKTVFDIGAHIGLYSIPASSVIDKDGTIYAFEPSAANRSYLERHIYFNKVNNIKVLPYLVGRESLEEVNFYENRDVDAMNSVIIRKNPHLYKRVFKKQVSIDDFCGKNKVWPEVIKIDVEGSEFEVINGAKQVFRNYNPIVFLSIHPKTLALLNRSVDELRLLINSLNYYIYTADEKKTERFEHNEYILIPKTGDFYEIF